MDLRRQGDAAAWYPVARITPRSAHRILWL